MTKPKKTHEETDKETAEAHWAWVETWLHIIYVDAMIHGMKHGREEKTR